MLRSVITPFCQRNARTGPDDRPRRPERRANHLASVVNAQAGAVNVPGKRAEVLHACLPGPQEGVKGCVAGQGRNTNHLTSVIDQSDISDPQHSSIYRSAEVAEVMDRAVVLPKHGVRPGCERGTTVFAHEPDMPTA